MSKNYSKFSLSVLKGKAALVAGAGVLEYHNLMNKDISAYNKAQEKDFKVICAELAKQIDAGLPKAESKLWHGGPVWFLDGNPVVGYSVRKGYVNLLFWSGQSFEERGLTKEGSFKAAEKRYATKTDIHVKDLSRWLKKAKAIQWDYKNIVKRKGKLILLETNKPSQPASKKQLKNGAKCVVIAGTHKGKFGTVEDIHTSKTGHVTITVRQSNGNRFKTLARNVSVE